MTKSGHQGPNLRQDRTHRGWIYNTSESAEDELDELKVMKELPAPPFILPLFKLQTPDSWLYIAYLVDTANADIHQDIQANLEN